MTVATRTSTPSCLVRGREDQGIGTKRGIIYCPGGLGTEMSWQTGGDPIRGIFEALSSTGFRIATIEDLLQYGNATHVGRVGSLYTAAQPSLGFDSSKVNLLGASAGGCAVLNWALANLSKVRSIGLIIPAVDIIDIDTNNRVSALGLDPVTQGPRSAYGGTTPPSGSNPASNAASFAGIPIKIWYSGNDNVVIPSTVTTFASAVGAPAVNMGNLGHAATGLAAEDVRAFFARNG